MNRTTQRGVEKSGAVGLIVGVLILGFVSFAPTSVSAQTTTFVMPIQPGVMDGSVVFITLVGPPDEGWITGVTMNLTFEATGTFDAGVLELDVSPPVEPNFPEWVVVGSDLGWSGQGTFTASVSTTSLNGHMVMSPLGGSFWNLDIHPLFSVGGGVWGNFTNSEIIVEYSLTPPSADPELTRGDSNDDGMVNIADAVFLLSSLFPTGAGVDLPCEDAADANDDGTLNIADAIATLQSLFGSPPAPLPSPTSCGVDPSADALGCDVGTSCP